MGKFRQNLKNLVHFEIWARFEIFQISRKWKKSGRYAHGFGRHMQNVGKKINFFSCQNRLLKVSRNRFLSFFDDFESPNHLPPDLAEKRQKRTLEAGFKSRISRSASTCPKIKFGPSFDAPGSGVSSTSRINIIRLTHEAMTTFFWNRKKKSSLRKPLKCYLSTLKT